MAVRFVRNFDGRESRTAFEGEALEMSALGFNDHVKPHGIRRKTAILLLALPMLAGGFTYREALPGYAYNFPRDHFEHEDFRTEWWYYTGNVTGARGERYGFELVFFRQGQHNDTENKSAWTVQDLYLAHAALTDVKGKRFWYEERLNRAGPGIA